LEPCAAKITAVGTFLQQHLDVAALLVIVSVLCVAAIQGIAVLRRHRQELRRLRPKGVRARLDVMRRDPDKMVESLGGLHEADPAVWQPFEHGLAAIAACQWDEAIEHFRAARAKADETQLAALFNQTGVCHYTRGRHDHALRNFEESVRLARQCGDEQGRAPALGNIGVILHDSGELDRALDALNEALAIVRKHADHRAAAPYLVNIGNIQRDKGELDRALISYREALEISRRAGDTPSVASGLRNIGNIHRDKDELDQALQRYEEALAVSRGAGDRAGIASSLSNIGSIHRYRGELDEALTFHERALALEREIGHEAGVATELGNIGLMLVSKGLHKQAVLTLGESLAILLDLGVARGPRPALLALSECDDRLGRERMQELLKQAGLVEAARADLLDRIDQMRLKRPRRRVSRRVPFVLRRLAAGSPS